MTIEAMVEKLIRCSDDSASRTIATSESEVLTATMWKTFFPLSTELQ